jgi:hypothetical protein
MRAVVLAVFVMAFVRTDERPAARAGAEPTFTQRITIEYKAPTSPHVVGVPRDHVTRIRALASLLEYQLRLPKSLKIVYQECGNANAYYRLWIPAIVVCHELWDKRRALYLGTGHDRETAYRNTHDAMLFTAFHELGHALHDQLKLPLLGNEEDAVDDIAALWMIRLGVGEAAIHAAYGHHLRAKQPEYDNSPWDDHNNGARRGYAIACLLYGADPERHVNVFREMNIPAPHITRCKDEYAERLSAWQKLLGMYLVQ